MATLTGDGGDFLDLCECIFGPQLGRLDRVLFHTSPFYKT